jgi:hypothetical protein
VVHADVPECRVVGMRYDYVSDFLCIGIHLVIKCMLEASFFIMLETIITLSGKVDLTFVISFLLVTAT